MTDYAPLYSTTSYGKGSQWVYRFPNGYGASVVQGRHTYGGSEGLWELAVVKWHGEGHDDWSICYDTPVTNDVLGWLTESDVQATLAKIEALPHG